MNSKTKIIMLGIIGLTALLIAAASSSEAPAPVWQDSMGLWTWRNPLDEEGNEGMLGLEIIGPEVNGKSFANVTRPMNDPTVGLFPDVTYRTPCLMLRVRTGPNSWESSGLGYGVTGQPGETVFLEVGARTETISEDGKSILMVGHGVVYSGRDDPDYVTPWGDPMPLHDQDTDPRDGLPDADEEPVFEFDFEKTVHRAPWIVPPSPPVE